jgi:hypothetical protein
MSVTINTSGGGGGGSIQSTDALVRIVTDYGSSVSVTAGGTTKNLKPLQIIGDSGKSCYYDLVKPGNFSSTARSYTASLGSDTASGSLVVNAAGEYTSDLSYWDGQLYLNGNQYTSHTGGWVAKKVKFADYTSGGYQVSAAYPTLEFESDTMVASISTSDYANYSGSVLTANAVDITNFNTITFELNNSGIGYTRTVICYVTNVDTQEGGIYSPAVNNTEYYTGDKTVTLDISGLTGNYYVGFNIRAEGSGTSIVTVRSIIMS